MIVFGENLVYTYKPRMNRIEGVRLLSRIRRWSRVPALLPLCFATVAVSALSSFDGANGANPSGALFQGANGDLYGTTRYGGASGVGASSGTIFIASISN